MSLAAIEREQFIAGRHIAGNFQPVTCNLKPI
jgi:hypothetical protein